MKVLLENLLRFEDGDDGHPRRPPGDGRLAEGAADRARDPVSPGARADAGLHRRSRGGRPRRDARRDDAARRRRAEDQSAGPGPPGHRPQRDGRRVRHPEGVRARTSSSNISATASATNSSNGAASAFDNFQVVPPGHRHLPPGQPGAYRAMRVDRRGPERRDGRLSRHAGRHRQPHDHGQRPRRARLGRRRDRGRGGDARPAGQHADPRSRRLPARRRAQGRHHRDRPRADRHPDAAPEGRRRPLRRILRARASTR